jgi:hypothetical protein
MAKWLKFLGMTAGGWIGWAIGSPVSFFTAFMLSGIGSGVGLWAGIRFSRYLLS